MNEVIAHLRDARGRFVATILALRDNDPRCGGRTPYGKVIVTWSKCRTSSPGLLYGKKNAEGLRDATILRPDAWNRKIGIAQALLKLVPGQPHGEIPQIIEKALPKFMVTRAAAFFKVSLEDIVVIGDHPKVDEFLVLIPSLLEKAKAWELLNPRKEKVEA